MRSTSRGFQVAAESGEIPDEQLVGIIDRSEADVLRLLRPEIRLRHSVLESERVYGWLGSTCHSTPSAGESSGVW
jgi:hypothetical protein